MTHINTRYKLRHDKIEHKLQEIAIHQCIDITYQIKSKWVEMINSTLYKVSNVSYLLYVNRIGPVTEPDDSKFKLMDIREIHFDKSEFRDLALDTIGV